MIIKKTVSNAETTAATRSGVLPRNAANAEAAKHTVTVTAPMIHVWTGTWPRKPEEPLAGKVLGRKNPAFFIFLVD